MIDYRMKYVSNLKSGPDAGLIIHEHFSAKNLDQAKERFKQTLHNRKLDPSNGEIVIYEMRD